LQLTGDDGKPAALGGTFLVAPSDRAGTRVAVLAVVPRAPVATSGQFVAGAVQASTYKLVGPMYFLFFAGLAVAAGLVFTFFTGLYPEQTHVRDEAESGLAG
jgi:POT family proton-dependent oligopeptide transporter